MQVQHTESKETLKNVDKPRVFTVWQKSSMGFQGTYGFSVYDNSGQLDFRVDNYSRKQKYLTKEIVLMDGNGKALICLRPRRYSMLQNVDKAEVLVKTSADNNKPKLVPGFRIEGCFERRNCKIYNSKREEVAQISRKTIGETSSVLLGNDVFSLVIQPRFNCSMVMAFVIVMDRLR
ncbi:protein LURP-one-related 5-like [Carex rostrata]